MEEKKEPKQRRFRRSRRRIIPIWLRLIIVFVLVIVSAAAGAMVGYGVIGEGKPLDVLKRSTWQHIADFVAKD